VDVLQVSEPGTDLPKLNALLSLAPSLVIDGLFGIGLNRPLSAEWLQFIETINNSKARILAVDVPSGLNAETGEAPGTAVRATVTLTVGAPKLGLLQESTWPFVGRLEVATDGGLAPLAATSELVWTQPEDFAGFPPVRPAATHKGSYGHIAIVAGSLGFHGAAVLAARGAQRAQPGLITLHTAESVYHVAASQLQAVMVSPWRPQNRLPGPWSAVLVGPGLAADDIPDQLKDLVRHLWRDSELPIVADATALNWLPLEFPRNALRIMTPHPGEAGRLLNIPSAQVQANRLQTLRSVSKRFNNAWVVLKGHQTLIGRANGEVYVNPSGNPHLAQGGSGDLLSGFIAGLVAQPGLRNDPLTLLRYAIWQHGAAADHLQSMRKNWVVEDLIDLLGDVPMSS
jgi:NAD(P)H-hydrate epimerase